MRLPTAIRCSAVLAAAVGVLLTGCARPTAMPAPTPSYSPSYVAPDPVALAPLTGEAVAPGSLAHAALAAKIDNHTAARPQVGLERTDLVFEELVEGGLTRYVAVWHSELPAEIGPVRSIRPMDPDIISPLGGIVAYSGGQQRFVSLMRDTGVYNAIHGMPDTEDVMFRTRDKRSPHNVLVRAPELVAAHPEIAAPGQQFAFAPDLDAATASVEGEPVGNAVVRFSTSSEPSWRFDPATRSWVRSQRGELDLDGAGAPLTAVNVVVVRVPISFGLGVPKTELIGGGEAWVLADGKAIAARWAKGSAGEQLRLVDLHGATVRLAPGNTWIELMPTTGALTLEPPAAP